MRTFKVVRTLELTEYIEADSEEEAVAIAREGGESGIDDAVVIDEVVHEVSD